MKKIKIDDSSLREEVVDSSLNEIKITGTISGKYNESQFSGFEIKE